jgi:hypothetical protein
MIYAADVQVVASRMSEQRPYTEHLTETNADLNEKSPIMNIGQTHGMAALEMPR